MSENTSGAVFVTEDMKNGQVSVFLNSRTNGAGQPFQVYSVRFDRDYRTVEVPVRFAGYDLTPTDAMDLAAGDELVVERVSSSKTSINPATGDVEPSRYLQMIAPMPMKTRQGDKQVFNSRPLTVAWPKFSKTDPDELQSFTVTNFDAKGEAIKDTEIKSFRYVGPKTTWPDGKERGMVKVLVPDAILAIQAIARGETFEIKGDGFTLPCKGIKQPETGSKFSTQLEWGYVKFDKEESAESADALPQESSASGKGKSR
jgi:hypothetical protein